MKLLTLLFLFVTISISAQFDVESGAITKDSITIGKIKYNIRTAPKGSPYIILKSPRTGNNYPLWIGEETDTIYEGYKLRKTRSGKFFIFRIVNKGRNPYCLYIKEKKIWKQKV